MKIAGRLAGLLLTGFLGFALISHGCTPSNPGLEQSKAEYDAGRYASAFRAAKQIADDPLQPRPHVSRRLISLASLR